MNAMYNLRILFGSIDDLNSTALQTSIIFHQVCQKSNLNHGILYFSIAVSYQIHFLKTSMYMLRCELNNCRKQFKQLKSVHDSKF